MNYRKVTELFFLSRCFEKHALLWKKNHINLATVYVMIRYNFIKPDIHLNNTQKFILYHTENTIYLFFR
jgi:hypothetical protein